MWFIGDFRVNEGTLIHIRDDDITERPIILASSIWLSLGVSWASLHEIKYVQSFV